MIGDTIVFTVNAVAKTLNKINQDSYSAEYFLRESAAEYTAKVSHQIPKGNATVEVHTIRFEVVDIVDGVKSNPMACWLNIKTDGVADATVLEQRAQALVDLLDNGTLIGQLIDRES